MIAVGGFRVDAVIDGEIRRPLIELYADAPADEMAEAQRWADPVSGELVMSIGSILVRSESRTVLIDCGLGPDPVGPFHGGAFRSTLGTLGVKREDITDVLFTHLHVDHIGWAVQGGRPYFPNATYRCDVRDWEHFVSPNYEFAPWELAGSVPDRDAASVRLAPLAEQMEFWRGDAEPVPGITALEAAGHTPGTTALLLESAGERALILGDVVHSVPELLHGWRFPVHHDHLAALAALERLRSFAAEEAIPCSAAHLTGMSWGRVHKSGKRFEWETIDNDVSFSP